MVVSKITCAIFITIFKIGMSILLKNNTIPAPEVSDANISVVLKSSEDIILYLTINDIHRFLCYATIGLPSKNCTS